MKTNSTTITLPNDSKNVKQKMINFLLLGVSILLLTSCSSNDDNDIIVEQFLDGLELETEIIENREEALQTTILNAGGSGEVYGAEGTILYFPVNSFEDQNGNPVTGAVTIELIEIYDKAKMLLTRMPTNGKRPNGDVETLVSGGEFYINAKQNGEQLQLVNDFMLFAPADEFDEDMRIFNGQNNNCDGDEMQCDIVWEEDEQGGLEPIQREGPNGQGVSGYGGFISNFGWTNLDRWYNFEGPKTIAYADVPQGFDNTNSNVYISYDGEPTALALLDIYNPETGLFSEHYGLLPIGLEVHFIFVSVQDDQYVYAIQGATIGENHTEVIGTTTTGTEAELVALINDLP
ncbi:hypothetical protein D1818_11910 [Aquimarina sp. BL5]|uniref:hypothetical protein n=1 Tax=Aquimarina sp. BL5 TaxID=1714860 RepID=UPI000E4B0B3C|nr:hypothetical protein [Aquimarina sp. BL5]AXT51501.1 hypothetical protein D1818_11910 [Aquimarina sp. BL5]RKN06930.1 hypothetical protein D7036_08360 [Aquimarina sp. BL5]